MTTQPLMTATDRWTHLRGERANVLEHGGAEPYYSPVAPLSRGQRATFKCAMFFQLSEREVAFHNIIDRWPPKSIIPIPVALVFGALSTRPLSCDEFLVSRDQPTSPGRRFAIVSP